MWGLNTPSYFACHFNMRTQHLHPTPSSIANTDLFSPAVFFTSTRHLLLLCFFCGMPNIPLRLFNALYWAQEQIRAGRSQRKARKAQKGRKSSTTGKSGEKRVGLKGVSFHFLCQISYFDSNTPPRSKTPS